MKTRLKRIWSSILLCTVCLCGIFGECQGVFANTPCSENQVLCDYDEECKQENGASSYDVKFTDIVKLETGNEGISRLNKSNEPAMLKASSSVTDYFDAEYNNALNMRGTSDEYYDIDFSSYSLYINSAEYKEMKKKIHDDLFSDSYDYDYDSYEFIYPNRFHLKGTFQPYGDTTTGKINKLRIYYSEYAPYLDSYYDAIVDMDEDINAYFSSSLTSLDEALLALHDMMIRELNFDYLDYKNGTSSNVMYNTAWGAMAGRKGLCKAYALIMKYYLDKLTVDNNHVRSRVVYSEKLGHYWNMVEVDGNWYHIDTAWDDLVVSSHNFKNTFSNVANKVGMYGDINPDYDDEGYVSHSYFLKTDSEMLAYGYKDWSAYFPLSDGCADELTPSSSRNQYAGICTNVEGNMPYAKGFWYIGPADGNSRGFIKTRYNGSSRSAISTNYRVRYLQTDGTNLYYTDGTRIIRTDLDGNNTMISNVAASGQTISEFVFKDGMFVYMLISGKTAKRVTKSLTELSWREGCEEHTWEKAVQEKATQKKDGIIAKVCKECGAVESTTTIKRIKSIKVTTSSFTYNGQAKEAKVKVVDSAGKTVSSSNYTLTYKNNKNVGVAQVTVKFKGKNYSGTKTLTYHIIPKSSSITKVKAISKGFEINWEQQSNQTSGYEIQYSTSEKFPSDNSKTIVVNNTLLKSGRAKSLKGNTTYYIRIRTFKTVGDEKIYSGWSKVVSVKTQR